MDPTVVKASEKRPPDVGEVEHDLHRTVRHRWQRQRHDGALIHVREAGRVDVSRRDT
jgi:hypothetical protein